MNGYLRLFVFLVLGVGAAQAPGVAAGSEAGGPPKGFRLEGTQWACEPEGGPVRGILVKPEGDGPFPAILISHGMGGSAARFSLLKAREFVKWGFVCIGPDYTHTAPGPERAQFGSSPENLRRARVCLEILAGLPYVDAKRICAYGNSMGAFVTIGLAAAEPKRLAAAAITAGGVSQAPGFPAPSPAEAAKVRTPFCILHGSTDHTVPPERSVALKEVLDRSAVPNERHLFEGIGHNLHAERADDVYRILKEWFAKRGVLKP